MGAQPSLYVVPAKGDLCVIVIPTKGGLCIIVIPAKAGTQGRGPQIRLRRIPAPSFGAQGSYAKVSEGGNPGVGDKVNGRQQSF